MDHIVARFHSADLAKYKITNSNLDLKNNEIEKIDNHLIDKVCNTRTWTFPHRSPCRRLWILLQLSSPLLPPSCRPFSYLKIRQPMTS
jgi:hypothetical protein